MIARAVVVGRQRLERIEREQHGVLVALTGQRGHAGRGRSGLLRRRGCGDGCSRGRGRSCCVVLLVRVGERVMALPVNSFHAFKTVYEFKVRGIENVYRTPGIGVPLILRYVLQTCETAAEAEAALRRIPTHMSYNVTVVDAERRYLTAYLAPDRAAAWAER